MGMEIILGTADGTPRCHESCGSSVGPFGGSVSLAQDRCMVCDECTSGMEIALGTPEWYSKVMYVTWKLVSVCFEIVLVLAQDKCTVCARCTSST